ncbi:PEGA domain-containing protein [Algoriphagus winogradskyi]|uniref:PEGA domain-containing protein n=1 Tax=Algoriphagus winogradskyi TaxID=237017 RepID=A0ABY1NRE6_9BACT|nr:PEGA domain-containing protein [Algoriphagus winogradskyi]SMP16063.1 PEGA domain-containing protein [Algoriphagus winogradskyi]
MKYKNLLTLSLLFLFSASLSFSQKLQITANHSDAKFILLNDYDDSDKQELGTGAIEYKLEKDSRNRIKITKPGYEPVIKEYNRDLKWDKDQYVSLDARRVEITAEPYDAEILVDGRVIGSKAIYLIIQKDRFHTVEIRKAGFAPISKSYYNSPDRETPPSKDYFELKDRQVRLEVIPADGVVTANGVSVGRGNQDIKIPLNDCVTVTVNKDGFVEYTKVFCNKPDTDPEPPVREKAQLEDRLVKITTNPNDAIIEIGGKTVGTGSYDLKVPKNGNVEIRVKKDGYVRYVKNYYNQANMQEPPVTEFIEMNVDEAYTSSVSSDLANVRITVPVNTVHTSEEAWRILSSIITRYFDILETVDFNTGYLTTSWQVQNFQSSIIRTRVIVSSGGNSDQLAYAIKLISQEAYLDGQNQVTVKDDEKFEDWARILKKYEGLIEEVQARLQQ